MVPTILYAAADLIWASKIKATADALGIAARPVRTPEMLAARLADTHPVAMLVDLDKGQEGLELISMLRTGEGSRPQVRILAWGPHVAKDLLQAARDCGADEVLTRGAFDHGLEEILLRLAARASSMP
jgi:CheY-like chemotaxis protein